MCTIRDQTQVKNDHLHIFTFTIKHKHEHIGIWISIETRWSFGLFWCLIEKAY